MATWKRILLALFAALSVATVATRELRAAQITPPPHQMEIVWCGGGGTYSPASDFIQPAKPMIQAMNTIPGAAEQQTVSWRFLRYIYTGTTWLYDNYTSPWQFATAIDQEGGYGYYGGAFSQPSNVLVPATPGAGKFYRLAWEVRWHNTANTVIAQSDLEWTGTHLNLVNGGYGWATYYCDYVPDYGLVN